MYPPPDLIIEDSTLESEDEVEIVERPVKRKKREERNDEEWLGRGKRRSSWLGEAGTVREQEGATKFASLAASAELNLLSPPAPFLPSHLDAPPSRSPSAFSNPKPKASASSVFDSFPGKAVKEFLRSWQESQGDEEG